MANSSQRNRKSATTASQWKKDSQGVPLDVPSGNVALVRPVGMQVFMQRGMIPNLLMPIVQEGIKGNQVDPAKIMEDLDLDAINDMLRLIDDIVVFTVVEPKVWPIPTWHPRHAENSLCHPEEVGEPIPADRREAVLKFDQPELEETVRLYVDEVMEDDKQFIFQFVVGGTRDVESFRKEQADALARVRSGENVASEAE